MRTALFILAASVAIAQTKPRVLLYYDMEGLSGINRRAQTNFPTKEYQEGRKLLTADVNAAIRGLIAGGAGEIVVTDAHGSGNSNEPDILLDQMDKRARFEFREHSFAPYIDMPSREFQAIACVGMHARANTPGFLAHTYSIEPSWRVNGLDITETEIIAHSAARFHLPVVMISGDDVLAKQIDERLPWAEYAMVKRAKGRGDAELLPLEEAHRAIEQAARRAIENLPKMKAFPLAPEFRFEIGFQNREQADRAANIPGLTRASDTSVAFTASNFVEGYQRTLPIMRLGGTERLNLLLRAVRSRPDADEILAEYNRLIEQRWYEGDRDPAPATAKRTRYHGSN